MKFSASTMFNPSTKAMLDLANSLKALKAFKGLISFPDPLFDITVGLMLGDLSAVKRYPNSMAVLKFCQSYKHLDYLIHLYDLFSLYVSSPPRVYEINRSSDSYLQVSFQTLSYPFFDQLYLLFYDPISRKKIVPENIGNLLTPLGLSYWFSDDGAKAGSFFFILMDSLRKTLFYLSLYWIPNSDFVVVFTNDKKVSMLFIYLLIAKSDLLDSSTLFCILL
jgi:hypothetical protein